jgi:glycosyltransferase involved in cell wall biosynthesis
MDPLVSILIPAFNAEEWIADTLRSAVSQSWQRKEIIVVDDGSTDRTLDIARRFASEGVSIISHTNQGAAAARNKALSVSRGDYIQWLDADDLLAPDKIARQIDALSRCRSRRTLLSSAWGRFLYRHHRAAFTPTALWCDLTPVEWLLRKMEQNLFMQTSTWLVSRELTEAAGRWNTAMLSDDDGEYFCRVLLGSDGVCFVPEAKVYYRMSGPGSLSQIRQSDRKTEAQLRSIQLHIGCLRSLEDSTRARAACLTYLQNWLIFFYPERPDLVRQAAEMAAQLGGRLQAPRLSRKYSWIAAIVGCSQAKRVQLHLSHIRWSSKRFWDKVLVSPTARL